MYVCVCALFIHVAIAGLNLKFELLTTEQDFYTAAEGKKSILSFLF